MIGKRALTARNLCAPVFYVHGLEFSVCDRIFQLSLHFRLVFTCNPFRADVIFIHRNTKRTGENEMNTKAHKYQVREFVGNDYSKRLGRRLRTYKEARRVVSMLKREGREVFCTSAS